MVELIPFIMFLTVCCALTAGYPVALTLAGTALIFAVIGSIAGYFDMSFLMALPNRLFGTIENITLIAVPLSLIHI